MKKVLIVLLVLSLLVGLGMLLFRIFVTGRITDKGGMENPEFSDVTSQSDNFGQRAPAHKKIQEEYHGTI